MHKGEGLRGGGAKEGPMVETGGSRQYSQGNFGGDLVGGQDTTDREGHPVGDRIGDIGGIWAESRRCGDGDGQ